MRMLLVMYTTDSNPIDTCKLKKEPSQFYSKYSANISNT